MNTAESSYKKVVQAYNERNPTSINSNGTHPLHSTWVLWSHPPASVSNNWDINSYVKHCTVSTVEDFWNVFNGMKSLVNPDMWFFMRKDIPPIWEHDINKQGGRYKFKIHGDKVDNVFLNLCVHLVTEHICISSSDSIFISGVSVSPKQKEQSTVSIWDIDSSVNDSKKFASNINGIDFVTGLYDDHASSKSRSERPRYGGGYSNSNGRGGKGGRSNGRGGGGRRSGRGGYRY
mgnify:CR=1 FL=1|uniref:Eukaryotic translation initiation factor 4E family protein n=1 Tax=viral metagenome TaxID=1070528 RepID=A0A6C0J776_9ZZZZ